MNIKSLGYSAVAAALSMPAVALAAPNPFNQARNLTNTVAEKGGINSSQDLPSMFGNIINVILGFMGILLLFYMLYAGFLWMTAGGDTKKVEKAQSIIQQAIIGLLIIVAAFAISNFVLGSLINVSTG